MRLETQSGLWIVDLEQPKTDKPKGKDTLFAFSFGYNLHADNITSTLSRYNFRHLLPICATFSANLSVILLLMDYPKERCKIKYVSLVQ